MHADNGQLAAMKCANAPPVRRRRRAVRRGRRVDRRTREAHLVSKLVSDLCQQIGDAARSPLVHADIVRCAELTVLAATARAHAMRSGGTMFDAESIARIEGAADRARRRLSVPSRAARRLNGSAAIDPTATLAVHCGNISYVDFGPYQSTRLSRYNAVS
jgi:hypothetical protein